MNPAQILSQNLNLNIGQIPVSTSMLQAGLIVFLLFLLILSLAQFRRHLLDWSIKGAIFGIFFGFLLALFVEGFLIIGGKTAITELLGWKNAPQPILSLLDSGRAKVVDVLGVSTTQITSSTAKEKSSVDKVIEG
ncbi:hypothetical protein HYZ70_00005, partial [Candidatus Curtissbacteria bacterium]|nr:hypothetical protein [Candidatus Curtissbacteria bacterium]